MRGLGRTVSIAAILLLASSIANATPIMYSGTNATGSFWDRPIGSGPGIRLGPIEYTVQAFFTDLAGTYDFFSSQNYDGYLHLYVNSFDPLNQLMGLIVGNDDFTGGIGTSGFDNIALMAGTQYFLVTSAFAAGQTGDFTNTITDDDGRANITLGTVASVPEPSTVALLTLGLAGLGLGRWKKRFG